MNALNITPIGLDDELLADGALLKAAVDVQEGLARALVLVDEVILIVEARILDADAFTDAGHAVRFHVGGECIPVRSSNDARLRRARHLADLAVA